MLVVHPHTLVFSSLLTLIPDNAQAHHWPSCCRSEHVSSKDTLRPSPPTPMPYLACFTQTSTLSCIIASWGKLSCPPGQVSCPSPLLDLSFCIFDSQVVPFCHLNNKLHKDKHCFLSTFHPIPSTQPGAWHTGSTQYHFGWMARPSGYQMGCAHREISTKWTEFLKLWNILQSS